MPKQETWAERVERVQREIREYLDLGEPPRIVLLPARNHGMSEQKPAGEDQSA